MVGSCQRPGEGPQEGPRAPRGRSLVVLRPRRGADSTRTPPAVVPSTHHSETTINHQHHSPHGRAGSAAGIRCSSVAPASRGFIHSKFNA